MLVLGTIKSAHPPALRAGLGEAERTCLVRRWKMLKS
jgi:hypothetical protein